MQKRCARFVTPETLINLTVNKFTFASVRSFCARTRNIHLEKTIHASVLVTRFNKKPNKVNSVINLYSKCNQIETESFFYSVIMYWIVFLENQSLFVMLGLVVRVVTERVFSFSLMHQFNFVFSDYRSS
jgi:hypothetical protein